MPAGCFTYMISLFHEHTIIIIVYMLKLRVGEMESFANYWIQIRTFLIKIRKFYVHYISTFNMNGDMKGRPGSWNHYVTGILG